MLLSFKTIRESLKSVAIIVGLLFVLFIVPNKCGRTRYESMLNSDVEGVVDSTFVDQMNHRSKTVLFRSGRKYVIDLFGSQVLTDSIYRSLDSGDSLFKENGANTLDVFKSGNTIRYFSDLPLSD
jgi:hypothetical protein